MNAVVIVAGGKGLRMGADIPKQFLCVGGRPILIRTLERFREYDAGLQIVLVLPHEQQAYWADLCRQYGFSIDYTLADGGPTRFHSVLNGLQKVAPDAALIAVHDGVRPYVSTEVIGRCFDEAARSGAVVPVVDEVETLRHLDSDGTSHTVPRSEYVRVQTPQVFEAQLLRRAYAQPFSERFTDDASVVESTGHAVALVAGNVENIKITTPNDLTC
ncbi:MAG: 2-C-methyl-D-erythritol 4-phosphate cytidylyltransferase [Bacteroidaceae bacterium]|nr:2-C-methyl-D-erythritol 4-phosphate cytidylyltransferase [Bacteroidaceae bacterium]